MRPVEAWQGLFLALWVVNSLLFPARSPIRPRLLEQPEMQSIRTCRKLVAPAQHCQPGRHEHFALVMQWSGTLAGRRRASSYSGIPHESLVADQLRARRDSQLSGTLLSTMHQALRNFVNHRRAICEEISRQRSELQRLTADKRISGESGRTRQRSTSSLQHASRYFVHPIESLRCPE